MTKNLKTFGLALTLVAWVGCSDDKDDKKDSSADAGAPLAASTGAFVLFPDPLGAGVENPAKDIKGSATAVGSGTGTKVTLTVSGLPKSKEFMAHVHKLACDDMKGGGHYQDKPGAVSDAGVLDPASVTATNEIWLNFTTDSSGAATVSSTVGFRVRAAEAKSIVIHALPGDAGGAPPRLACLPIPF